MFENMPTQLKADWLALLEDPTSTQARLKLCRTDGSKCCLGWLLQAMYGDNWQESSNSVEYMINNNNNHNAILDNYNLTKAGLTRAEQDKLVTYNDGYKFSLAKIAQCIRNNGEL